MPTLFLDLDGTIRQTKSGAKFINQPEDQKLIQGAKEAIAYFADRGYLIIGVTNQGGVGAGHKSLSSCIIEQQITLDLCPELNKILFCPDIEGEKLYCVTRNRGFLVDIEQRNRELKQLDKSFKKEVYDSFRKPGIGMVQYAFNTHKIYRKDTLLVGDREEDVLCAETFGCRFLIAEEWRNCFGFLTAPQKQACDFPL